MKQPSNAVSRNRCRLLRHDDGGVEDVEMRPRRVAGLVVKDDDKALLASKMNDQRTLLVVRYDHPLQQFGIADDDHSDLDRLQLIALDVASGSFAGANGRAAHPDSLEKRRIRVV